MSDLGGLDSDDENAWDEVVPDYSVLEEVPSTSKPIEITLQPANVHPAKKKQAERSEKSKQIQAERVLRVESHKLHTICLLKSACTRNRWINDELLHARLLSLTPLPLQNAFSSITKKRIPDQARRGRLFEGAIMRLTEWWHSLFQVTELGHIRSRTFRQAQMDMHDDDFLEQFEVLRAPKSLSKRAMTHRGSRDTSAMLFAALCRSLLIPTRLVISLQSAPWQAAVGKKSKTSKPSDPKGKGKARAETPGDVLEDGGIEEDDDDDDMEEVAIPGFSDDASASASPQMSVSSAFEDSPKPGSSKPPISLRRHVIKSNRRRRNGIPRTNAPPIGGWPPTIWVEVFSRPDSRWLPVDPVRYIVNKKKLMEPPAHDENNRMVYVVALEEDGFIRDVTRRYASEYTTKTLKARVGVRNGQQEWWSEIMSMLARPYRLARDEFEDEELETAQYREGMPTSIAGFKNHPLYALERHLKQTEVIFPPEEVGRFRGEPVYPRCNVIALKTSENWTRMGRKVKEGCQPLKMVKAHAATINRRRAIEMARSAGENIGMQGLYAFDQTELYVPDPVVDGKVPKNEFGNIDLYTPSMLPQGAVHIPFSGVAKVARNLGIDYAEAVTSFEFRQGRAFPVLTGIVVAAENETVVIEAYLETAQNEEEKRRIRTREKVLKLWSKLINGLRIHQRIQEQYGGDGRKEKTMEAEDPEIAPAGGFIADADRSVAPYTLPKPSGSLINPDVQSPASPPEDGRLIGFDFTLTPALPLTVLTDSVRKNAEDQDLIELPNSPTVTKLSGTPITMQKLAESEHARAVKTKPSPVVQRENEDVQPRRLRSNVNKGKRSAEISESEGYESEARVAAKRIRLSPHSTGSTPTRRSLRPRRQKSKADLKAAAAAEEAIRQALEEDE